MTEDQILDEILRREGSAYTNRPSDRGGSTKFGITLETLREERGPYVSFVDVQNLTESAARVIYRQRYIRRPGFDKIPDERLRAFVVDFGVNSGPKRAAVALQGAIGVSADGIIGPETVARLADIEAPNVYAAMLRARLRLYVDIVLNDPPVASFRTAHPNTQLSNLRGWINRLSEFF